MTWRVAGGRMAAMLHYAAAAPRHGILNEAAMLCHADAGSISFVSAVLNQSDRARLDDNLVDTARETRPVHEYSAGVAGAVMSGGRILQAQVSLLDRFVMKQNDPSILIVF